MHGFLFQIRTALSSILGASRMAKQLKEEISVDMHAWLERWNPVVEDWYSAENDAHLLLEDGAVHDWEQVVYDMANRMKDVSAAYLEGRNLAIPESPNGKMVFKLAMESGFEYLNKLILPILGRDFRFLLQ